MSRSKWRRTGALVTATVQLQRTTTGPNLINTAVENAKMAETQIRRARGAYAGLFFLMVRATQQLTVAIQSQHNLFFTKLLSTESIQPDPVATSVVPNSVATKLY